MGHHELVGDVSRVVHRKPHGQDDEDAREQLECQSKQLNAPGDPNEGEEDAREDPDGDLEVPDQKEDDDEDPQQSQADVPR